MRDMWSLHQSCSKALQKQHCSIWRIRTGPFHQRRYPSKENEGYSRSTGFVFPINATCVKKGTISSKCGEQAVLHKFADGKDEWKRHQDLKRRWRCWYLDSKNGCKMFNFCLYPPNWRRYRSSCTGVFLLQWRLQRPRLQIWTEMWGEGGEEESVGHCLPQAAVGKGIVWSLACYPCQCRMRHNINDIWNRERSARKEIPKSWWV